MSDGSRNRVVLAALLCAALALRVVFIVISSPADDAYITFRYAENLAAGHGFVYNPGERILGTTTPLFTVLLVPFVLAGLPPDVMALVLAVLFDLGICVLLFWMFRRSLGDTGGLAVVGIYGLFYASAAACGYGMETQFFELLVVASLALLVVARYDAAAAMAGLAAITRPEGFLLAAIVGVSTLARAGGRERFARSLGVFLAVAGPWYVFAWLYFGSPIPNSVHTKLFQDSMTAGQWLDFFVTRNPVVLLLWLAAAVGGTLGVRRRDAASMSLAAWAVLYALFFLVTRPPFAGGWYFPPLVLPLTVLAAVAAVALGERILGTPARAAAAALTLAVALDAAVLPRSVASNRWSRTVARSVFVPVAEWVRDNTDVDVVVHAADIGYLGYFSRRRILDASALVTPDVRRYYAEHGGVPNLDIALVLEKLPDVVVLPVRVDTYRRFDASAFTDHYRPVARFQVEGATELHPPPDVADRYAMDARFMADYLVYTREPGPGD